MQKKTFSLLVFHGSAREIANHAACEFARALSAEHGCIDFSICFLKGFAPELKDAISSAIDSGEKHIHLIPLFLLPGSHTSSDIPGIVKQFSLTHPAIEITIADYLAADPEFIKYVARQIKSGS